MITINSNTRQFNVPGADLVFGVVADSDAERKYFQCPRYVGDNLDLAACFIRINYRNANGKTDFYLVDDMVIDGDNITFSWLLSPKVTEYRGQIKFVMCAVGPDLKLKWHTTQGTGQVMEGLEPDNSHVESQTADVVAQLISMVESQTSAVEKVGADQVAAVNTTAKTAQDNAVTAIETAGKNTRDSIPADYTALSDAVRKTAPGIVCSAEGEVITLNDASDNGLRGLRIFGRSTQDGTPTPESPAEIVSVGDSGIVDVNVCGKNLLKNNFAGTTTTDKGITFIHNEDGTIIINGTAAERARANFAKLTLPAGRYILSQGITDKTGKKPILFAALYIAGESVWVDLAGNSEIPFTLEEPTEISVVCDIRYPGETYTNFVVLPMIRLASISDDTFEPYKVATTVAVQNKNGLPGIPVTSGGNYTDANGQQWICDEIDFERGVYVRRTRKTSVDGSADERWEVSSIQSVPGATRFDARMQNEPRAGMEYCLSDSYASSAHANTGSETCWCNAGSSTYLQFRICTAYATTVDELLERIQAKPVNFIYQLTTPIETPLSETELAAYRALHTNKPNTTILNDSGAYMSVDYTADTKLYIDNKIKEALL